MESYELNAGAIYTGRNKITGRFMKGHIPANKGKKLTDFVKDEHKLENIKKTWHNFDNHRPKHIPDNAGRCAKKVIGITKSGKEYLFPSVTSASIKICTSTTNISRCCKLNDNAKVNSKTGDKNTDHSVKGIRWYYYDDDKWMDKIS